MRGPGRKPRINVCRAIFMETLAGSQIRLVKLPGKRKGRRVVVEMAGKADMVKGLQLILERGARGLGLKEFNQDGRHLREGVPPSAPRGKERRQPGAAARDFRPSD